MPISPILTWVIYKYFSFLWSLKGIAALRWVHQIEIVLITIDYVLKISEAAGDKRE